MGTPEGRARSRQHTAPMRSRRYYLRVDHSEQNAALVSLARACGDFDVQMVRLAIGDYFIDGGVVVERKTYADFAVSLSDGRFFPQAAALSRSPHRPVVLLEGPKPPKMPDVHPHALQGALVSLAVMWRLPVLYARDPHDSLQILRFLAQQVGNAWHSILRRYDRNPNASPRESSTCFRVCRALVRHWRIGCYSNSAR